MLGWRRYGRCFRLRLEIAAPPASSQIDRDRISFGHHAVKAPLPGFQNEAHAATGNFLKQFIIAQPFGLKPFHKVLWKIFHRKPAV